MMASNNELPHKFVEEVIRHLEANDIPAAVNIFNNKENVLYLKNNSWELIPFLSKHISKEAKVNNNDLEACCEELLEKLAEEANPEEGVLEFLEQMDEADSLKFGVVLRLLKIVLSRNTTSKIKSLEWTLNSIRSYTEQFSVTKNTDDFDVVNEEDNFFSIEKIEEIESIMSSVINFYEDFVGEFKEMPEAEEVRCLLSTRLIQMFDIFFPYVNTEVIPQLRIIEEKMQSLLLQLIPNPLSLLEYVFYRALNVLKTSSGSVSPKKIDINMSDEDFSALGAFDENLNPLEDEAIVSNLAYGTFFFSLLKLSENEEIRMPLIYNPKYIMLSLIYVTVPFFEEKTNTSVNNGLKFLDLLLNHLNGLLTKSELYFSSHKSILIHLNNIMIFSELEENRKLALKCFKKYIESFDWEGRYWLLFHFRSHVHHSGTLGFLISLLKDFVSTFLELAPTSHLHHKFLKYYKGKLLFDIIKKYCFLKNNTNVDLVENADHVISSLNALRYLVLRDKKNVTDVRHFIKRIYLDFLSPLKENIKTSKSYYDLKLKDLMNNASASSVASCGSEAEVELAVKGETLPKLTKEQQKTAYESCLNDAYSIRHCSSKDQNSNEDDTKKKESSEDREYETNIREKILNASLQFVPKYGWTKNAITSGAESVGYPGIANGIFPNGGADLIKYFYIQCNQKLKDYMIDMSTKAEKPMEPKHFIQNSIEVRLRMIIPYIEKWPQAIAIMSSPPNVPVALANLLTLVDDICFYAGDKSVDFSWYTRRIGVGGIYKMSEFYMLQDKSPDYEETWKFLDRRLTEAIQVQQVLNSSSDATNVAKDVVSAVFTTARNILRLNVPR